MDLREIFTLFSAGIGVLIMLVSSFGVLNLSDVFVRMHGFGKASTLGISGLILAAGIYYPEYLARMIVLVVLFFITGPIATTALTRAAYKVAPPSVKQKLIINEMESGPRRARKAKPAKKKKSR
ncbi:MAG: monovalent cation/H(+) antiporter subunit G [Anaerolineales bacterium]|nr:MAG: monovalent cation/H(+) antiporter subunit G [Anaerolineales bacterium]